MAPPAALTNSGASGESTGASSLISEALETIWSELIDDHRGTRANYIPSLATVNPNQFGIAVVSTGGGVYEAGDSRVEHTIQSVSKPFVYALALADLDLERVLRWVGVEPSGEAYNAVSLEAETGRPPNPMVNAGAIVTTSLVAGEDAAEQFDRILAKMSAFAGRSLHMDETVFESEAYFGDRNRALAYLMRSAGALQGDVGSVLDVYFRQCSVLVTSTDVAVMGATLANDGVNPLTGERVLTEEVAQHVLTIMATCGMYDYAGEWLLRAGVPAKSGVSGSLAAVSPGQFGIGLFSPPLDAHGNSIRAVVAAQRLAEQFELHLMHRPGQTSPVVQDSGTAVEFDAYVDDPATAAVLEAHGGAVSVRVLQGEVNFAAAEAILCSLDTLPNPLAGGRRWLVLDICQVTRIGNAGAEMIAKLFARLREQLVEIVIVERSTTSLFPGSDYQCRTLDEALLWCGNRLRTLTGQNDTGRGAAADNPGGN